MVKRDGFSFVLALTLALVWSAFSVSKAAATDACSDPTVQKGSSPVIANGTTAVPATDVLIGAVPGKSDYICGVSVEAITAGTLQFIQGTGPTCGGSRKFLTGTLNLAAGSYAPIPNWQSITMLLAEPGMELCVTTTGNMQGFIIGGQR